MGELKAERNFARDMEAETVVNIQVVIRVHKELNFASIMEAGNGVNNQDVILRLGHLAFVRPI